MVNASQSLFGDQETPPTGSFPAVTSLGHPPLVGTIQICGIPLRSVMRAMCLASGEKLGAKARPTRAMRSTKAAVSVSLAFTGAVTGGCCALDEMSNTRVSARKANPRFTAGLQVQPANLFARRNRVKRT